jgi:lipopolysaccharide export LptBFGC system permease protein LptF
MSADVFPKTGEVRIADADHALTISSQNCQLDKERRPRFIDDVMISEVLADGTTRTIRADSATLDMRRERRLEDVVIDVEATGNVSIEDSRDRGSIQRRDREKFDPVALSPQIVEQARAYDANVLLDPNSGSLRLGEWVDQRRAHVIEGVARVSRDVTAELHARLAFSVSVFVLVILGAALGIVFRGSQVLVAFGISFVPSVLVISTIIMGKQLIEKPGTTLTGIGVMWAGIALVALVDGFVLTKVVRR